MSFKTFQKMEYLNERVGTPFSDRHTSDAVLTCKNVVPVSVPTSSVWEFLSKVWDYLESVLDYNIV